MKSTLCQRNLGNPIQMYAIEGSINCYPQIGVCYLSFDHAAEHRGRVEE